MSLLFSLLQQVNVRRALGGLFPRYTPYCRQCSRRENSPGGEYEAIYNFPYIRQISVFSKLKVYHIVSTLISVPVSFVLTSHGVDPDLPLLTAIIGTGVGAFLFSIGAVTTRYVGFIYVDRRMENMKVAYVDFWGRRQEEIFPIDDVIPFSDTHTNFFNSALYKPLLRFSGRGSYKLNVEYGNIMDTEKFNRIFVM